MNLPTSNENIRTAKYPISKVKRHKIFATNITDVGLNLLTHEVLTTREKKPNELQENGRKLSAVCAEKRYVSLRCMNRCLVLVMSRKNEIKCQWCSVSHLSDWQNSKDLTISYAGETGNPGDLTDLGWEHTMCSLSGGTEVYHAKGCRHLAFGHDRASVNLCPGHVGKTHTDTHPMPSLWLCAVGAKAENSECRSQDVG